MAGGKPGRGSDQFPLRFPDGMRDHLKTAAEANNRSMNAEIIAQLEAHDEITRLRADLDFISKTTGYYKEELEKEQNNNRKLLSRIARGDRELEGRIDEAKRIIKHLIETSERYRYDDTRVKSEYEAVLFLFDVPLEDLRNTKDLIKYREIIEDQYIIQDVPEGIRSDIREMINEAIDPILNYLKSLEWKIDPPADWPTDK